MNAKIENLSISVGGRTIDLTLEEAQALQAELNSKLGDTRAFPITIIREIIQPQIAGPTYVYPNTTPLNPPWHTTCALGAVNRVPEIQCFVNQ